MNLLAELKRFKGQSTREIKEVIGRAIGSCVAVHRNDLVPATNQAPKPESRRCRLAPFDTMRSFR
jgi:hypothetical protein